MIKKITAVLVAIIMFIFPVYYCMEALKLSPPIIVMLFTPVIIGAIALWEAF